MHDDRQFAHSLLGYRSPIVDRVTHWVRSAIFHVLFVMLPLLRTYPVPIDQAFASYVLYTLLELQSR